ncbi:MAG: glycosyltransferase [Planctomycetota bacterium]
MPQSVTVVVPAYNAAGTLDACIEAILASDAEIAEVIIADDGSTDGSAKRAASPHELVRVLRVGDAPGGPANARNLAAKSASGDVLVFVDADVRVHPDAVGLLAGAIDDASESPIEGGVAASFGSYDDNPPDSRASSIYANLRHHYVHQMAPAEGGTFWSGLGAFRRDTFLELGGFDLSFEKPSIEDVELGARLRASGGRIRIVHGAQGTHLKAWPLLNLWKTDIFARALPWAKLSVDHPELLSSLNAGAKEKVAALCVGVWLAMLVSLPIAVPMVGWVAPMLVLAVCSGVWSLINTRLLALLAKRGGARALWIGAALHAVYYLYSAAAYVLGGSMFTWSAELGSKNRPAALLWTSGILAAFAAAGVCVAVSSVDTAWLNSRLLALEQDPSTARYTVESLGPVQDRVLVLGGIIGVAACGLLVIGPRWLGRELRGAAVLVRESISGMPKPHALMIALLTAVFAVFASLHLDQQMRSDESSSYMMYGQASPFVALFTYEVPNNHILHSAMLWTSIRLFGIDEWAVRLPAFLVSLLMPALLYAAGRSLLSARAGLLACGIAVGGVFAVDIATNARGYPIIIACMLGLLALAPALAQARTGASLIAIALGVIGLYAVPMMAYPLGIAYTAAGLIVVWGERISIHRVVSHGVRLGLVGATTCAAAAMLYLPAWALRTSSASPIGTIDEAQSAPSELRAIDVGSIVYNSRAALTQWIQPLDASLLWIAGPIALAGFAAMLLSRRQSRALGVALVIGPAAVLVITMFRSPPWWSLAWGYPLFVLVTAAALAAIVRGHRSAMIATPLLAAGMIAAASLSPYPARSAYWVGYRDAPAVAAELQRLGVRDAHVLGHGGLFRDVTYQLNRLGISGKPVDKTGSLADPVRARVLHIRASRTDEPYYFDELSEEVLGRTEMIATHAAGGSTIDEYRVLDRVDPEPNSESNSEPEPEHEL